MLPHRVCVLVVGRMGAGRNKSRTKENAFGGDACSEGRSEVACGWPVEGCPGDTEVEASQKKLKGEELEEEKCFRQKGPKVQRCPVKAGVAHCQDSSEQSPFCLPREF